jgi:hypothetical protein
MTRESWLDRAREAWPWVRVIAYAVLFVWWLGRRTDDPVYALLAGVFLADISAWVLFDALVVPFRGPRFAIQLGANIALTWIAWHASPYADRSVQPEVMPFAVLAFLITFIGKSLARVWRYLIPDE